MLPTHLAGSYTAHLTPEVWWQQNTFGNHGPFGLGHLIGPQASHLQSLLQNLPCQPVPGPQQMLKQAYLSRNDLTPQHSALTGVFDSVKGGQVPCCLPLLAPPLTPPLLSNTATASTGQDLREDGAAALAV